MDFYHQGPATLHDLGIAPEGHVRRIVERAAAGRHVALVLPMVHDEMRRPAIQGIREGLMDATFLHELVVPLTAADAEQVQEVRRLFAPLPYPVRVLWCEGPRTQEVLAGLAERGLDLTAFGGKGLAVWLGFGIAAAENEALAVHDADIEDYRASLLERLVLPVLVDDLDFFFAKGYYARVTGDALYGRVVRLFVWPFLDALQRTLPQRSPLVAYLRSFRYPLAGEMALTSDLARNLRMPTDWGLEVGLLGEVYRNASPKRICQVDLGLYSHKHKPVGESVSEGLRRMVLDIATTLYRSLAATEGARLDRDLLQTLRLAYRREAQDAIRRYHADAFFNGLRHERHQEEAVVEVFADLIAEAGRRYSDGSEDTICEWLRAASADPSAAARLRDASRLRPSDRDALAEAALADGER
ncbi:MAG TPA: glucosyl-3-phosphoglycerate synthase [Candidatus Thermoplasmatota archaeon]|nr:glucosyl-3-phosphoglycerate synthase [Candidatus Thermoplasmatota archaeon]